MGITNSLNEAKILNRIASFNALTTEVAYARFIDTATTKERKYLVALLYERHPIYTGRSTNTMIKMRAYTMAAFSRIGLPEQALPYVLEALESSFNPYMVAAAAMALRGQELPHIQISKYLIKAFYNIWQGDQPVNFETYSVKWPLKVFSTGLLEIFETLQWMGAYAENSLADLELILMNYGDKLNATSRLQLSQAITAINIDERVVDANCCDLELVQPNTFNTKPMGLDYLPNLPLEDQDSYNTQWDTFFKGKPTVIAFFYTRCANPRKCTLTIQNLVNIQKALAKKGLSNKVKVAAITYDPKYDSAFALKTYGDARRFTFNKDNKMFRVTKGFETLIDALNLGVNFNESLVNEHRIELFVLDTNGQLAQSFLRLQTEPLKIVAALDSMLNPEKEAVFISQTTTKTKKTFKGLREKTNTVFSFVLPIFIAFFPKCPVCWLAYMSVFGVVGIDAIPYSPWVLPLLFILLPINLYYLYKTSKKRNGITPFVLCAVGSILLILNYSFVGLHQLFLYAGITFLFVGSLLQSLNYVMFNKLRLVLLNIRYRLSL